MKKISLAFAAALCLLAVPAAANPLRANVDTIAPKFASDVQLAQLTVQIGRGGARRRGPPRCQMVTVRERRGNRVIVTKTRRCR